MRLHADQLAEHLRGPLAPIYILGGDEPLQMGELTDSIRAVARNRGYSERLVFHVSSEFTWDRLEIEASTLSLFAEQRIIELRLAKAKPGPAGAKALENYATNPPKDILLLISTGRMDHKTQQTKWLQMLEKNGVLLLVWPIERKHLPTWIYNRMRSRGLQPDQEAIQILAERTEGNMLAAAQEIDKLVLLQGTGSVDAEGMRQATMDSARFGVYDLVDACLQGDARRSVRILEGLRAEDCGSVLVLWALHREVRMLSAMAFALQRDESLIRLCQKYRVLDRRRQLVEAGLTRHTLQQWQGILCYCSEVDRINKGISFGDPWEALLHLTMHIVGLEKVPGKINHSLGNQDQ